jgi:metal-responsive CopG/Arc/MetJ family transcriptional regulator
MKVAVSIPDPVFADAEALAKQLKFSRSKLYARALGAFVASHAPERVTEAMNAAVDAAGQQPDAFVRQAGQRILARSEW